MSNQTCISLPRFYCTYPFFFLFSIWIDIRIHWPLVRLADSCPVLAWFCLKNVPVKRGLCLPTVTDKGPSDGWGFLSIIEFYLTYNNDCLNAAIIVIWCYIHDFFDFIYLFWQGFVVYSVTWDGNFLKSERHSSDDLIDLLIIHT